MALKEKLPVSYLLFTNRGRINRLTYWTGNLFIWTTFYVLFNLLSSAISYSATWIIYPLLFIALWATASKRLHDSNKSGHWLWIAAIPVLGPLFLFYILGFRRGNAGNNRYGMVPGAASDYFKNPDAEKIPHLKTEERIINDVTRLNPVIVAEVAAPVSIPALCQLIKETTKPISIGGGRFSMGGQTASSGSLHIDMRKLNRVISFSKEHKTITVEAGIRWCDIQQYIDPFDLSIKIMQTYANFTVGGALSVNCHGRYIGLGAVILSVRSIEIILADGTLKTVSPGIEPLLFYACIGCYNAIAVIASVTFDLTENVAVKRSFKKMKRQEYRQFFLEQIKDRAGVIFHNGDIYPPAYKNVRAVSWTKTDEQPTVKTRLMPLSAAYPIERYFISAFSKSSFGKWRRENIIDPVLYLSKKVHWRNYEAGYDVAELEPKSRLKSTYVLQEYFIPLQYFDAFSEAMASIFSSHKVNVINVSVRHAEKDPGSLLAWAKDEVFAFVIWYKQRTSEEAKTKVGVWTRALIDAALQNMGSYYLPYQAHATEQQFHAAYPKAKELFGIKNKLDPHYKFRNIIWDTYYKPTKHEH